MNLCYRLARLFMIAWLGMVFAFLITILVRWAIVPSSTFTEGAYRFGVMWMAVCWSIALADHINQLKAETESAKRNLQNSKRRLTQTLEAMPVGVVVYGTDQKPTFSNQRTTDILANPTLGIGPDLSFAGVAYEVGAVTAEGAIVEAGVVAEDEAVVVDDIITDEGEIIAVTAFADEEE